MENREKIIQLLENPLISGYGIKKMSNGRLYSANYQRYKKRVEKKKKKPMVIFDTMSVKVEKLLLELAEEVLRVRPKTKQEYREMIARYSFRNGEN
jgi:replicative DNA helicase